jgi:hypothetical protein
MVHKWFLIIVTIKWVFFSQLFLSNNMVLAHKRRYLFFQFIFCHVLHRKKSNLKIKKKFECNFCMSYMSSFEIFTEILFSFFILQAITKLNIIEIQQLFLIKNRQNSSFIILSSKYQKKTPRTFNFWVFVSANFQFQHMTTNTLKYCKNF